MRILAAYLFILLTGFTFMQDDKPVVYLIGDSTCADKEPENFPETGWGTPFKQFFRPPVTIANHAKNGRSTKSFREEGLWDVVMKSLKAGDYVFIQFGHNDEVPSKVGRYTTPEQFLDNLSNYVADTRSKGATPVLLTPVSRRSFDPEGTLLNTHEAYAELVREVAESEKVPLIDMTASSMALIVDLGEDRSRQLFLHLEPGEHPNYPDGAQDNTHFNESGARKMARLVLNGIRELNLELTQYIINEK